MGNLIEENPRLYWVWHSMRNRCENPNRDNYPLYGGRGIAVCDEWRRSSRAFVEWALASGYEDGLQLDRVDNDGPYSPENCRWATRSENGRNKRNNRRITLLCMSKTVAEWREVLDISQFTLYWWLREYGQQGCEKRVYKRLYERM